MQVDLRVNWLQNPNQWLQTIKAATLFNPYMYLMNGFSHYHLGQSTFIIRDIRSDFELLFHFSIKFLSKQNSPRWDATFCSVPSGAILFAYVPQKGCQPYMSQISALWLLSLTLVVISSCKGLNVCPPFNICHTEK